MARIARMTVKCDMLHTPSSPGKNRARRNMLEKIDPKKDLITISHGVLEAMMMLRWKGSIIVCDIDKGVIDSTFYQVKDYPELDILPPTHMTIQATVFAYPHRFGIKRLGGVDVDLTYCIKQAWNVLKGVLDTLIQFKIHTKVFLTFRNGRNDGFVSLAGRIAWLRNRLGAMYPNGLVKYISHEKYDSARNREDASRQIGSHMCIVELHT